VLGFGNVPNGDLGFNNISKLIMAMIQEFGDVKDKGGKAKQLVCAYVCV